MKTKRIAVAVAIVALAAGSYVLAGIDGSKHDMATQSWSTEICLPCHAPHGKTTVSGAPLWNHAATAAVSYTLYDGTVETTITDALDGASLLCMSCHDGSTNADAFGGAAGTTKLSGVYNVGTDFSDDHPLGAQGNFTDASGMNVPDANNDGIAGNETFSATGVNLIVMDIGGTDKLVAGCGSCHDPHGGAALTKMLHASNADSAVCLACHNI